MQQRGFGDRGSAFAAQWWPLLLCALAVPPPAQADLILPPGAHAEASARSVANDGGTVSNDSPGTATANNQINNPDSAIASAESTLGGAVKSRSSISAASGSGESTEASAIARWASNYTTVGANPGGPIDLDFTLQVTGELGLFDNNSGADLNDLLASVDVGLTAHDTGGATSLFTGNTTLTIISDRPQAAELQRSGDWADASRDGDFTELEADPGSPHWALATTIVFEDALFTNFGDMFALELVLGTHAFGYAGRELEAFANFFNTGSVSLTTNTLGVSIVPANTPNPSVPEPGTVLILALGLSGLALRRKG